VVLWDKNYKTKQKTKGMKMDLVRLEALAVVDARRD
jgi:hypothetical protein